MAIGVGLIERDNNNNLYNTWVVCMPDGSLQKHRKLHAFEHPVICSGGVTQAVNRRTADPVLINKSVCTDTFFLKCLPKWLVSNHASSSLFLLQKSIF